MQRHMILTLGRSGSNTLSDMLNQSPEVLNFGEVLGEWTRIRRIQRRLHLFRSSDEAFLNWILYSRHFSYFANLTRSLGKRRRGTVGSAKRYQDIKTIGIKEFSLNFERYGLGDYLSRHRDLKVIGLVRENIVDRLVSNLRLGATGVVAVRSGATSNTQALHVDPERMLFLLGVIEDENAALREMLRRVPESSVMLIRYEDLFRNEISPDEVMAAAFDFLGVKRVTTAVRMTKIIQTPIPDLIANFDECLRAVRGTRYETLLRDVDA